jgi:hypothetical protein
MGIIEVTRSTSTAENSSQSARAMTPIILRRAAGGWIGSGAPFCAETAGSGRHKQKWHDATFGPLPEGVTRSQSSHWQAIGGIPE